MKFARDEILSEIRKITVANGGRPPGSGSFETITGIGPAAWRGVHWARWSDALREAGLAPNERFTKSDSETVLAQFCAAARHYGHLPTAAELRMYRRAHPECPSEKTIHTHFGSKAALLVRLQAWVAGRDDCADIAAMLGPMPQAALRAATAVDERSSRQSLVYLMRSGGHYKIGRSDRIEKRVREIRVALPEPLSLVHSIRTDDPVGIEAYWHRRFKDRRANGEWFRLSHADVAAFKRRKFQ